MTRRGGRARAARVSSPEHSLMRVQESVGAIENSQRGRSENTGSRAFRRKLSSVKELDAFHAL
jgi:hypothetical protein